MVKQGSNGAQACLVEWLHFAAFGCGAAASHLTRFSAAKEKIQLRPNAPLDTPAFAPYLAGCC